MSKLADAITADNALELLAQVACGHCCVVGMFKLFHEPNNNGTGIVCGCCDTRHPLRETQRIMWLRHGGEKKQKRSNDIAAVMRERGNYCYGCGIDLATLRQCNIGTHVHHTRPFAEHGDKFPKIPLCALCHELLSAVQRQLPKLLAKTLTGRIENE